MSVESDLRTVTDTGWQPPEPATLDEVIAGHLIRHHEWTEDDVARCTDLEGHHDSYHSPDGAHNGT